MRKQTFGLPSHFPNLPDRLNAEDFWRSKGRKDLVSDIETVITEFRAHHEALGNRFASWPAAWKTWYIRALRFTPPPKMAPEPRAKGRNAREAFRAPADEQELVSHKVVLELADKLRAKSTTKPWR